MDIDKQLLFIMVLLVKSDTDGFIFLHLSNQNSL